MSAWITRAVIYLGLIALTAGESRLTLVPDVSEANSVIGIPGNSTDDLQGSILLPRMGTTVKLTCIVNIPRTTCPPQIIWLKDYAVLRGESNTHSNVNIHTLQITTMNGFTVRSTLQFAARDGNDSGLYACWVDSTRNATFNVRVIDKVGYLPWLNEQSICDRREVLFCAVHNGTGHNFLQLNPETEYEGNFTYCASEFYVNSTYQVVPAKIDPSVAKKILWPSKDDKGDPGSSRCVLARKTDLWEKHDFFPDITRIFQDNGYLFALICCAVVLSVVLACCYFLLFKSFSRCKSNATSAPVSPF